MIFFPFFVKRSFTLFYVRTPNQLGLEKYRVIKFNLIRLVHFAFYISRKYMPMKKDTHHEKPYDEATITKLDFYEEYLKAWISVFLHVDYYRYLRILDFFSESGCDSIGQKGSPLILVDELSKPENEEKIREKGYTVRILFNDINKSKIEDLKKKIPSSFPYQIRYRSDKFLDIYDEYLTKVGNEPALIFIDQFGFSALNKEVIERLVTCPHADFIAFSASNSLLRFGEDAANKEYISSLGITNDEIKSIKPYEIHQLFVSKIQEKWIPENYFLGEFTILNKGNYYGLIFGSHSLIGLEKFVKAAWKKDSISGKANFPIEASKMQCELFPLNGNLEPVIHKTKIQELVEELESDIVSGYLNSDFMVWKKCLLRGVDPSKALKTFYYDLKKKGIIAFNRDNQPRYTSVVRKHPRKIVLVKCQTNHT